MNIAFFGSSILSAYWNGAATYYRGLIKALHQVGHRTTFYEPDAFDRQQHTDMTEPPWCRVCVYQASDHGVQSAFSQATRDCDVLVKASGVGVFDEWLEAEVARSSRPGMMKIFWDVDAPATLDRLDRHPEDAFRDLIAKYDCILTYGGGLPVTTAYRNYGARECIPVYNAVDPETHHPVSPDPRFSADLSFLGNRLPDRETRVDRFFFDVARHMDSSRFLLGGNGWGDKELPHNVNYIGHVYTKDHNALNCSGLAVLNISRDSMARYGFSPATRVFEAAAAGACMITDSWEGLDEFLEPETEVLAAGSGEEVAEQLKQISSDRARSIGQKALQRVLAHHTYRHRAAQVHHLLTASHQQREVPILR